MATIHNTELTDQIKQGIRIQQLKDEVPSQLAEKVVPTLECNPKFFREINIVRSRPDVGIIYTAPADVDFYLTNAQISIANATGDILTTITCRPFSDSADRVICSVDTHGSQVGQAFAMNYNFPLKVQRGTNISLTSTGGVAMSGIICGYLTRDQTN